MTSITALHDREPALSMGLLTFVGGFLAQTGVAGVGSVKALGTAAVASGLQALLAREKVVSPAHAREWVRCPLAPAEVASRLTALRTPQNAEPALLMALVAAFAAFLLQVVGHTGLLQAVGTSGGIAGVQGLLTRQRAWAPATVVQRRWELTLDGLLRPVRETLSAALAVPGGGSATSESDVR